MIGRLCLLLLFASSFGGRALYGQCCPCNGDVDGIGGVNIADTTLWQNCFQGLPGACAACVVANCDVNCNGAVDFQDGVAIACMISAGGVSPKPDCCAGQNIAAGVVPPCECVGDTDCASGEQCVESFCVLSGVPAASDWGLLVIALAMMIMGSLVLLRLRPGAASS